VAEAVALSMVGSTDIHGGSQGGPQIY
jgi:hypothetical protein